MDSVEQKYVIFKIIVFIMGRRRKNIDSLNKFGKFYLIFYLIVSIALNNKFVREVYISKSVTKVTRYIKQFFDERYIYK